MTLITMIIIMTVNITNNLLHIAMKFARACRFFSYKLYTNFCRKMSVLKVLRDKYIYTLNYNCDRFNNCFFFLFYICIAVIPINRFIINSAYVSRTKHRVILFYYILLLGPSKKSYSKNRSHCRRNYQKCL